MKNNNSNHTQVVMNANSKASKKKVTRKQAEANARRKEAKSWALLAHGVKYKEAAAKHSCNLATMQIEDELFDGILLNLCDRNSVKSTSAQKRILRRIVEKRQAQQAHRQIGRTDSRYASHILQRCASQSMSDLHRHQMCA